MTFENLQLLRRGVEPFATRRAIGDEIARIVIGVDQQLPRRNAHHDGA